MQKFLRLFAAGGISLALSGAVLSQGVFADACTNGGGVDVSSALGAPNGCVGGTAYGGNGANPIFALISIVITIATGVLGLIMVLMIVIAGLQYVISNGSPDIVRDAKNRIGSVAMGFGLFILMWGILQILLPADARVFQ